MGWGWGGRRKEAGRVSDPDGNVQDHCPVPPWGTATCNPTLLWEIFSDELGEQLHKFFFSALLFLIPLKILNIECEGLDTVVIL